jgi:hypothetical protein
MPRRSPNFQALICEEGLRACRYMTESTGLLAVSFEDEPGMKNCTMKDTDRTAIMVIVGGLWIRLAGIR